MWFLRRMVKISLIKKVANDNLLRTAKTAVNEANGEDTI